MPPRIETTRLILRPFILSDIDEAYEVLEGNPEVWRYDPGYCRTKLQRANLIKKYAQDNDENGFGNLAVVLKSTGELIGHTGLQSYRLGDQPQSPLEVELFYKLGRDFWGKGYAFEACRALISYAFNRLNLPRLVTATHSDNSPSIRLMRRLGFSFHSHPGAWSSEVIGILERR
jgi:[ribosomal protein S5]-alanine N-acetyltransferase